MDNERTTRERLFEPGKYVALPTVLMARSDLTPAGKLVWAALASHLRHASMTVWPSMARLADMTALSRDTIISCISRLESMGLLVIERVTGRSSQYRILQPEAAVHMSEKPTGRKNPPVGKTAATGRKNPLPPVGNSDPELLKGSTGEKRTPLPPRGAGGVGESISDALQKGTPNGAAAEAAPATAEEAVASVNRAWESVLGMATPAKVRRAVKRGWTRGDDGWLVHVDAAAIRGGMAMAKKAGGTFGLGWVRKHIEQLAEAGQRAAAAKRLQADAAEQAAKRAAEQAALQEAQRCKVAGQVDAFRRLSQAERDRWIERVRAKGGTFRLPKRVEEQMAAEMAAGESGE